jgi:DNA-binding transcriptional LysR family regulator
MTTDGTTFLDRGRRMLQDATEAVEEFAAQRGTLVGPLRISAPVSFGTLHLGTTLFPFLAANPGLDLTLDLEDRFVDVAADGYDAVIRHGAVRDAHLIARRLASSRRVLVAAPAYLQTHAVPRTLAELKSHRAILYRHRDADWRFANGGTSTVVRPLRALRLNHGLLMRDAAAAGLGLALLPTFIVYREVAAGILRTINVGAEAEGADIHLTYAKQRSTSAKLRALTECLQQAFGNPPYWERPSPRISTSPRRARQPLPRSPAGRT